VNIPGPAEAIALISWSFVIPCAIAMGWHAGKVCGAIIFGATKSTTDVKISDIKVLDNR
jgi:hypothetical protein